MGGVKSWRFEVMQSAEWLNLTVFMHESIFSAGCFEKKR